MRRVGILFVICLAMPAVSRAAEPADFRCPSSLFAPGYCGDGRTAVDSGLHVPLDVAVEPDGSVLIIDYGNLVLRRVRDGRVASAGEIPAFANSLAVTPTGEKAFTDWDQITRDSGTVGTGEDGYRDYVDARFGLLNSPQDIAAAADGSLVIADTNNHRVRVVRPDGALVTLAGNGMPGGAGDGGPALSAELDRPRAVAAMPDGAVVVATGEGRLRRIAPDGTIHRIGTRDFLRGVTLAPLPDGTVAVGVARTRRVLKVAMDGTRTVLAKGGRCGMADDDRRPGAAGLNFISGLAATADGDVLVADAGSHRVLRVSASAVEVVAGGGLRPPAACRAIRSLPRAAPVPRADAPPTVYELSPSTTGEGGVAGHEDDTRVGLSRGCAGRRGRSFDVNFQFATPGTPRAGKPFTVAYSVGARASVVVTALGRVRQKARAVGGGLVTLRFKGLPTGRYRLAFRATAKGQTLCLISRLRVK